MFSLNQVSARPPLIPKEIPTSYPPLTIEVLTDDVDFHRFLKENPSDNSYYASVRSNLWTTAKIATFTAYAALGVAMVVLAGIFFPIYIPIATLAVLSILPLVYGAYEFCEKRSDLAHDLSKQEQGIAAKVKELETDKSSLPGKIEELTKDSGISLVFKTKDGSVTTDPFEQAAKDKGFLLLLARHLYWKEEAEKCMASAGGHYAKARMLEEILEQEPDMEAKKAIETRHKLNRELDDWYETSVGAALAKAEGAFVRYLFANPYHKKELSETCSLHHCPRYLSYIGETLADSFPHAIPTPVEAVRFKEGPAIDLVKHLSIMLSMTAKPILDACVAQDEASFKEACKTVGAKIASNPGIEKNLVYLFAQPHSVEKTAQAKELKKERFIARLEPKYEVANPRAKWNFPSDHLPVGSQINGRTFVSWDLASKNPAEKQEALTQSILAMTEGEKKKSVIALQNCTEELSKSLKLPENYAMSKISDTSSILFDTTVFEKQNSVAGIKVSHLVLTDAEYGREYLLSSINNSVDQTGEAPLKLFTALKQNAKERGQTALLLGNMNCSPVELVETIQKTPKVKTPQVVFSYPTSWEGDGEKVTSMTSSQIWIGAPKTVPAQVKQLRPDQLVDGAQEALKLLISK